MYSQFAGTDPIVGIRFALNSDPEAQDNYKVRIITAGMSHGNGHGARDLA